MDGSNGALQAPRRGVRRAAHRPPSGHVFKAQRKSGTKRLAEEWLRELLDQARRGTLPGLVRTGVTVKDAAAEYMRYIEHDRERKPSTVKGYRWIIDSQIAHPVLAASTPAYARQPRCR